MNALAPLAFLSIPALTGCEAQSGHAHVVSPHGSGAHVSTHGGGGGGGGGADGLLDLLAVLADAASVAQDAHEEAEAEKMAQAESVARSRDVAPPPPPPAPASPPSTRTRTQERLATNLRIAPHGNRTLSSSPRGTIHIGPT